MDSDAVFALARPLSLVVTQFGIFLSLNPISISDTKSLVYCSHKVACCFVASVGQYGLLGTLLYFDRSFVSGRCVENYYSPSTRESLSSYMTTVFLSCFL
ncbi:hypothetical protein CEXT_123411 [Caerostris extrusa]|uniref:Uncharacterized protein n=1 Tax=Caerostris extrusa TaxID=172846 RepID=A0AAV4MQ85_CAEEX|nr:hypothetical protein CEXT_123411 [Caerostris extrusa]